MKLSQAKIGKNYNKLVIIFIVITILIVLFIGYFAFSKTTITVKTIPQETVASFNTNLDQIEGKLFFTEVEGSKEYTDLPSVKKVKAKATGKVTIYNNYTADQPLVKTTRLLSEEGVLFRTQETVTVPKGGQVEVEVIADQEGKEGNIKPSKFEIVALWPGKKEFIYAESKTAMEGGIKEIKTVREEDITAAQTELIEELKEKAYVNLNEQLKAKQNQNLTLDVDSLFTEIIDENISAQVGDEVEKLEINTKVKVIALALNKENLFSDALHQAQENLSSDYELSQNISPENLKYTITEYNLEKETATLRITLTGKARLKQDSTILDKSKLIGKSKQDAISYLEDFPEIETVTIDFSPFWVTSVPHIENNIKIIVE